MPTLVPMHSVVLSRPTDRKDKEGNPVHQRLAPKVGEPFEFTDEEAEDLRRSGHRIREPINEGGTEFADADEVDRVATQAADEARKLRTAPLDAANTARAAAKGKGARKQPDNSGAAEAPGEEAEDADEL